MDIGIHFGKYGFHCKGNSKELETAICLFLAVGITLPHAFFCGKTLYNRQTNGKKTKEETGNNEEERKRSIIAEPVVRQASDILPRGSNFDDHQLVGKLLYREDICLCYGEEHVGKTSIILNWAIDIVLQRQSNIMKDGSGVRQPYHCIWYNGEMDNADFDVFFGSFDRKLLDGKIDFIDGFAHMNLTEWFGDVKKRLSSCTDDTVVILDNLSTVSNGYDCENTEIFNNIKQTQEEMRQNGISVTFILLGHTNKNGDMKGANNLNALCSNRIRFSSYAPKHTKISVEKNRKYHDMVNKSFNLRWTTSPEGYKSYENLGEITDSDKTSTSKASKDDLITTKTNGRKKKYSDEEILEFHRIVEETGNKSEAKRQTGIPHQTYDKRIKKLIAEGKCNTNSNNS